MNNANPSAARRQRGMALLIALVVLLVVTLLGVAAMRSAIFQNRISINTQMSVQSFQAAESGLDAAMKLAAQQSRGADGIAGTADDIDASNPDHVFNQAINDPDHPRRVCVTKAGIEVDANHGVRNKDGSLGFDQACDRLPGAVTQVTTVVSESPDRSELLEGFDVSAGAALAIQVRAEGDVPDTNVAAVHVADWVRAGPGTGTD